MSLLDTASLIVTPNGYKEGKLYSVIPSDGAGDMSVTRATTATRVNSAGLVELVPYNLLSYSESPVTSPWGTNATLTANAATAPDGTMTATRVQLASGSAQYLYQGVPFLSGTKTISCYIKGATAQTIGFNDGNAVTNSINITTEWQRYTFTYNTNSGGMGIQFDNYFGVSPSQQAKDFYVWGAQLVEGSTAKDYQKTETRLNIPRLDYSNGTCPSLLVEPQRTNLLTYSSSFDNAAWTKVNTTITANATTSPDGTTSADSCNFTAGGSSYINTGTTFGGNSDVVISVFVKANSVSIFRIRESFYTGVNCVFDLSAQTAGTNGKIENYGNGWYRCSFKYNLSAGQTNINFIFDSNTAIGSLYLWGAQAEIGSYATSYIPTTSASVTRNADVISKTGISSLIGQTEGVVFLDYYASAQNQDALTYAFLFVGGNSTNNIQLYNSGTTLYWYLRNTAGVIIDQTANQTLVAGTRYKIALAYKSGEYALYINGVQKRTSTNSSAPPAMSQFNLNADDVGASAAKVKNEFNAVAFWPTRLTNDQLTALTTI
jgi:hypothetical protein